MIAFVSDRDGAENLWVASADGSDARPLTKDKQSLFASPSWTPDGDYVLASRQPQLPWGAFELWMYHVRGGSGVPVTKGKPKPDSKPDEYVHAIGAVASRDGKYPLLHQADQDVQRLQQPGFPLVAGRAARPGDGRRGHGHRGPRQRVPPGPLARRDQARLRHARRQRDRAADPRAGHAARSAGSSSRSSATSRSRATPAT